LTGARGVVSAIGGEPPKVDGSVDVLDLMVGGTLAAHNALGPAFEEVLSIMGRTRAEGGSRDDLRASVAALLSLKPGNPPAERLAAITATAFLLLIVEDVDREFGA
jgi:hypothetical protein